jgi:glutamate formiminotransferase/formiminotetrahydrofolate cyclodeaminase
VTLFSRATVTCHCLQVIDAIAAAIRDTAGCTLLDVEPGASTNRTVYTFVGGPAAVVRGAFNGAQVARRLIDMAVHKGKGAQLRQLQC